MVELKITGPCENCGYIDLDLKTMYLNDQKEYFIECEHAPICWRLKDEISTKRTSYNFDFCKS